MNTNQIATETNDFAQTYNRDAVLEGAVEVFRKAEEQEAEARATEQGMLDDATRVFSASKKYGEIGREMALEMGRISERVEKNIETARKIIALYPRKGEEGKALGVVLKLLEENTADFLTAQVKEYADWFDTSKAQHGTRETHLPMACDWFSQRCWERAESERWMKAAVPDWIADPMTLWGFKADHCASGVDYWSSDLDMLIETFRVDAGEWEFRVSHPLTEFSNKTTVVDFCGIRRVERVTSKENEVAEAINTLVRWYRAARFPKSLDLSDVVDLMRDPLDKIEKELGSVCPMEHEALHFWFARLLRRYNVICEEKVLRIP